MLNKNVIYKDNELVKGVEIRIHWKKKYFTKFFGFPKSYPLKINYFIN